MPGAPVGVGASVMVTPGATGAAPDTGVIVFVPPPFVTASGLPLAVSGSVCQMVDSTKGIPYPLVIGEPAGSGVRVGGRALVRVGDLIPSPPGVLLVLGPPAAPYLTDGWPP